MRCQLSNLKDEKFGWLRLAMTKVFVAVVIGVVIHYTPLATMALASAHNQRGENRLAYNRVVNPAQHKNAVNYLPQF